MKSDTRCDTLCVRRDDNCSRAIGYVEQDGVQAQAAELKRLHAEPVAEWGSCKGPSWRGHLGGSYERTH